MIKDMLKFESDIQCSINLSLDYNDKNKKENYILTSKSIEILNEIVNPIYESTSKKSKILIGPYGKGKSHLALYTLGMFASDNKNLDYYSKFNNKKIGSSLERFLNDNDKYLPVILNSTPYNKNFGDILIYSLKSALSIYGLDDVVLDFYFEKALNKIENWEKNHKIIYENFINILDDDIEEFKNRLRNYNEKSYMKFNEIYSQLTGEKEFNGCIDVDPIKVYEEVNQEIKKYGYKGMFILYDEFSKYIEYLTSENKVLDIKLIQDFAELCNRSNDQKMIVLLISHKSIGQYVNGNEGSIKIDNWKAIEGRFDEIQYIDFAGDQYEIISSSIKKDLEKWKEVKNTYQDYFEKLKQNYFVRNLFKELTEEQFIEWVIYGAYPLHPISTFILPRISERVAQNERTLFSFLCKDENNTLKDLVFKNNSVIMPNSIYDYFSDNILNLGYKDENSKRLLDCRNIISKASRDIEKNILKTIFLIHMINDFDIIKPNIKAIEVLYGEEGIKAINTLVEKNLLIQRKTVDVLDIPTSKDIEILSEIENIKANNKNFNYIEFINDRFKNIYIESRQHNDKNSIIRYFNIKFYSDNMNYDYVVNDLTLENADGIIYISDECEIDVLPKNVLVIQNKFSNNIKNLLHDIYAINELRSKASLDFILQEELDRIKFTYEESFKEYVEEIVDLSFNNRVIHEGKIIDVNNKRDISRFISKIMDEIYFRTPIVNNEMINKNNLSKVVENSSKKIIEQILSEENNNIINFRKGSLESTIIRSVLMLNGAIKELNQGEYIISDNLEDNKNFSQLLFDIYEEIEHSNKNKISFQKLYDICTLKEYGYGLKKGVIPIILAYILKKYRRKVSVFENETEIFIDENTVSKINKNPKEYAFKIQAIDCRKEEYIKRLEEIFKNNIDDNVNRKNDFVYLNLAIKKWFIYLPKYTKDARKLYLGNQENQGLNKSIIKFKNKVRILNENSKAFLFEELMSIFEAKSYDMLLESIEKAKFTVENLFPSLLTGIEKDIRKIFNIGTSNSLSDGIYIWKSSINGQDNILDSNILKVLEFIDTHRGVTNSEEYLNRFSGCLLGIYLSDWNESSIDKFLNKILELKDLEKLNDRKYEDEKLQKVEISVSLDTNLSSKAELLLNDIKDTLDDYGDTISFEEKKIVMLKIINNFS